MVRGVGVGPASRAAAPLAATAPDPTLSETILKPRVSSQIRPSSGVQGPDAGASHIRETGNQNVGFSAAEP